MDKNHTLNEMVSAIQKKRASLVEAVYQAHGQPISPAVSPGDDWNPFLKFDTAWHPDATKAHAACREWVYAVSSGQRRGLVLWSKANPRLKQTGYGTGKTILATMAHDTLKVMYDHEGQAQRVKFANAPDFIQDIKDAYSKNAPVANLFDDWTRGHFIMDDWGKQYATERGEEWVREQFYRIINRLYEARRGFLLTCNLSPADLEAQIGGASWSRLLGMCGPSGFVDMSAVPDYRLKLGGFVG